MWIVPLPDRCVACARQGGGGALSIAELISVLKANTLDQILRRFNLLHTDSAKAYKRLGPPRWPTAGDLCGAFEFAALFAQHGYTHTYVTHEKKIGVPKQFTAERRVLVEFKRNWWNSNG